MSFTRTTYVEYLFHGGQLEELQSISREVATRDTEGIEVPGGAFGFQFYDILTTVVVDRETSDGKVQVVLSSDPINRSVTYYYGGTIMTEAEIMQDPNLVGLQVEMKQKGCSRMIKVRKDIFRPFYDTDVYIEPSA